GSPTDIYRHPQSKFVAEFVGQVTLMQVVPQGANRGHLEELGVVVPFEGRDKAHLVLRPEHIRRAGETGADSENIVEFAGKVIDSAFLGHCQSYMVRTAGGKVIEFQESHATSRPPLAVGSDVRVQFSMSDAVV